MISLATKPRQALAVTGMTCGGCASGIERVLSRVPGVERVRVDLAGARAFVEGSVSAAALVAAVAAAGYGATPIEG